MTSNPWTTIDSWLASNAPRVLRSLRPPVETGDMTRLERELGRLPASLVTAYRAHDGVSKEEHALFGALRAPRDAKWVRTMWWLRADAALRRYQFMRDLPIDWPPALLPIAEDAGGNIVVVDVAEGRCSAWDHETGGTTTLAADLGAWISTLADDMNAGLVVAGSEEDDDDTTLTLLDAPLPPPPEAPVVGPDRAARVLLEVLVERRFIELAAGVGREALVAALMRALTTKGAKKRCAAVRSVLRDSDAVEEVFADAVEEVFAEDDWMDVVVGEVV